MEDLKTKLLNSLLQTLCYDEMNDEQMALVVEYETELRKPLVDELFIDKHSVEEIKSSIHDWWKDYQIADGTEDKLYEYVDNLKFMKKYQYVKKVHKHNGNIVIELNDEGNKYIFSDQEQNEKSCVGWETHNVPFDDQNHYFYEHKSTCNGKRFTGYAWYNPMESYIEEFADLESCLNWLCDIE